MKGGGCDLMWRTWGLYSLRDGLARRERSIPAAPQAGVVWARRLGRKRCVAPGGSLKPHQPSSTATDMMIEERLDMMKRKEIKAC